MHTRAVCAVAWVLLLALGAWAQANPNPVTGVAYQVRIEGLDAAGLDATARGIAETVTRRDERPRSLTHLRRRAERDRARLLELLRGEAYYAAEVEVRIERDAEPVRVLLLAAPGPRYRLGAVTFTARPAGTPAPDWPAPEAVGLGAGNFATAGALLDATGQLLTHLRANGYPFPEERNRRVVVDHAVPEVRAEYLIAPGPRAGYGPLRIEGLETVRPEVIEKRVPWKPGETYEDSALGRFTATLYETQLFAIARVEPIDAVEDGRVPIRVAVKEADHRTLALGLTFETERGAGAEVRWEHRNMRGRGERLRLEADWLQDAIGFEARYLVPLVNQPGETIEGVLGTRDEDTEAFDVTEVQAGLHYTRPLRARLKLRVGVRASAGQVEQFDETDGFGLAAMPLTLDYDARDDAVNPTRGFRLRGTIEPFFGSSTFVRAEATGSHYLRLGGPRLVLATQLRVGSTWLTDDVFDVPAHERYYAGGGGSLRGYPFQEAGVLVGNAPLGGRSLIEAAVELRRQVTDSIGVVAFVDGGTTYRNAYPDFKEDLLFGAGLGLRYNTPIGPLRFDVAVPLNKRAGIDSNFEVYVAFGQTF